MLSLQNGWHPHGFNRANKVLYRLNLHSRHCSPDRRPRRARGEDDHSTRLQRFRSIVSARLQTPAHEATLEFRGSSLREAIRTLT
ncbi:hypothetical protein MPLDJ20_20083 [Mesorhizobium plurifarium]|uniref:Uncharacterized protein n=1 Tax=Mesorhizobium plurifarium TaxID=69974 RepID=A0A090GKB9_MESPL|nr:hypothetical protein MPLDJ20_20083 [Mesorhizobium plurifarium]